MRTLICIGIDDAVCINPVYPHTAGCVNNLFTIKQQTYMCNLTFFIVKKCQVTAPNLF